jgi:hypothetical protein
MNGQLKPVRAGEPALQWPGFKPFQLVRLTEIMIPVTLDFVNLLRDLGPTVKGFTLDHAITPDTKIDIEGAQSILGVFELVERHLKDTFGLRESTKLAKRITDQLREDIATGLILAQPIHVNSDVLGSRIKDELDNLVFGYIPTDLAKYHRHKELFGPTVAAKFPVANKEITDAGTCLAHGLNTAAVFHSMRAVEICAKTMVHNMGRKNT